MHPLYDVISLKTNDKETMEHRERWEYACLDDFKKIIVLEHLELLRKQVEKMKSKGRRDCELRQLEQY